MENNEMEQFYDDLSTFDEDSLLSASKILKVYAEQGASFLTTGVSIRLNRENHEVCLMDKENNCAMLNNEQLEQWFTCPGYGNDICGQEGFKEDFGFNEDSHLCQECYIKEIDEEEDIFDQEDAEAEEEAEEFENPDAEE